VLANYPLQSSLVDPTPLLCRFFLLTYKRVSSPAMFPVKRFRHYSASGRSACASRPVQHGYLRPIVSIMSKRAVASLSCPCLPLPAHYSAYRTELMDSGTNSSRSAGDACILDRVLLSTQSQPCDDRSLVRCHKQPPAGCLTSRSAQRLAQAQTVAARHSHLLGPAIHLPQPSLLRPNLSILQSDGQPNHPSRSSRRTYR
jgi:hypothetical protein